MLKTLCTAAGLLAAMTFAQNAGAQSYKNAVGLRIEVGTGSTWVGPSLKHFFNQHSAGEFQLLFAPRNTVLLDFEYQYHGAIQNARGLNWYLGLGPAIALYKGGGSDLYLRPIIGLDYKIPNAPLNFGFDWRPTFRATHSEAKNQFTAARFSFPIRITF